MGIKIIARGLAYLALSGALFATAIALNNRQYPTAEASKTKPSLIPGAFDAELVHCKAVGSEAVNDAVCKAVWEANRKRFFEPHTSPSEEELSKAPPQSPTTRGTSPSVPSASGRGAREQ